jgi:hypothetical protein
MSRIANDTTTASFNHRHDRLVVSHESVWIGDVQVNHKVYRHHSLYALSEPNITDNTVKFHVTNVMLKLKASDRTHTVVNALQQGIIKL